jgi:hypothetical protein
VVDHKDAGVRAFAEPLTKAKRRGHPTEAGSEDEDLVLRCVVGEERLRPVLVMRSGLCRCPPDECRNAAADDRACHDSAPSVAHRRLPSND